MLYAERACYRTSVVCLSVWHTCGSRNNGWMLIKFHKASSLPPTDCIKNTIKKVNSSTDYRLLIDGQKRNETVPWLGLSTINDHYKYIGLYKQKLTQPRISHHSSHWIQLIHERHLLAALWGYSRHTPSSPSAAVTWWVSAFTDLNLYCIKGALALFVLVSFSGYMC